MRSKLTPKFRKSVSDYIEDIKYANRTRLDGSEIHPTITISREFGCAGYPLARTLVKKLSKPNDKWEMYSRDLLKSITDEADLSDIISEQMDAKKRNKIFQDLQELLDVAPSDFSKYKQLAQNVRIIGDRGKAVIVGSGSSIFAQKEPNFFNVRITGSFDFRVNRIMKELQLSRYEAEKTVSEQTSERMKFIQQFSRQDISDPALYHIVLRNDFFEVDEMADIIILAMKKTEMLINNN